MITLIPKNFKGLRLVRAALAEIQAATESEDLQTVRRKLVVLQSEVEDLRSRIPEYRLEYDLDFRSASFARLSSSLDNMGGGRALVFCRTNFDEQFFLSAQDMPAFSYDFKNFLYAYFNDSALPIWRA